ncbi:MAG: general secretion pathway protein GspC [Leptospiraceae bacterium]|nr:general secretion pathway protein GspC [Leptospiraceae bacterium]MCP5511754.1 general secretion pathway protein GspC [Leptospiraceae bacterium]
MNGILLRLQKNGFYLLFPIVILLSYSLASVARATIVFLFSGNEEIAGSSLKLNNPNQNKKVPKTVNVYEDTVTGNMIRGASLTPEMLQGGNQAGGPNQSIELTEDVPGAEELFITGIISGASRYARATIKEKDKDEAEEYAIGDKVAGYRIKKILQHYVVLYKNGVNIKVEVGETLAEAKKRILENEPEKQEDSFFDGNCPVTKRKISRTSFQGLLKNPADIYKDARFGPNLVEGQIDGYKLFQVPSTHIFYQLGARNGDIIKRVNGMPLNDTEKMIEIWNNVKNSSKVTVDLDRRGKCATYDFTIGN